MTTGGVPARHRDIETEELLEDQQHKIRELERQVAALRDKLMVARQQITGAGMKSSNQQQQPSSARRHPPRSSRPPPSVVAGLSPSPVPPAPPSQAMLGAPPGPLLSAQAMRLLEEARNENKMLEDGVAGLKEKINICEQELEQQREQHKIKEANYEEEIQILKAQVL